MNIRILLVILFCTSFTACDVINPDESIPAYIKVDDFALVTNNSTEGANTTNIRDVWVYIDNDIQGVYELPAEFPILAEGTKEITMRAGIALNGIASTRTQYPFYQFTSENVQLIPGQSTTVSPSTEYFSGIDFAWIEDFEDSGFSLDKTTRSDTGMFKVSKPDPNVMYGNSCGAIFMQDNHLIAEFESTFNLLLPKGGADVFLEIDYKNNHPFVIGVTAVDGSSEAQESVIALNAKSDWNKIYVDLTGAVSSALSANSYKIFIRVVRSQEFPNPEIYLDNIKVVHE